MPIPGTVQITGQLAPTATTDTFPTHADIYGYGGLRAVANSTARNAITTDRSSLGMFVVLQSDFSVWQLTTYPPTGSNSDWTQFTGGGGVTSVTGTAPIVSSGGSTPAISINVFGASGGSHSTGAVPDPGSTAGTTRFLREDATWAVAGGGGSTDPYQHLVVWLSNALSTDGAVYNDWALCGNTWTIGAGSWPSYSAGTGPFGGSSITPTTSVMYVANANTMGMGLMDFTWEAWVYLSSAPSLSWLLYNGDSTAFSPRAGIALGTAGNGGIAWYLGGSSTVAKSGVAPTLSVWTHVAYSRASFVGKLFVNGTQVGSNLSDTSQYSVNPGIGWGGNTAGSNTLSGLGLLGPMRITKGVARYTANFTAPTTYFPTPAL